MKVTDGIVTNWTAWGGPDCRCKRCTTAATSRRHSVRSPSVGCFRVARLVGGFTPPPHSPGARKVWHGDSSEREVITIEPLLRAPHPIVPPVRLLQRSPPTRSVGRILRVAREVVVEHVGVDVEPSAVDFDHRHRRKAVDPPQARRVPRRPFGVRIPDQQYDGVTVERGLNSRDVGPRQRRLEAPTSLPNACSDSISAPRRIRPRSADTGNVAPRSPNPASNPEATDIP